MTADPTAESVGRRNSYLLMKRALKQARRPTHYPDYLDDPEGFERLREAARTKDGHAFTACNNNSVWRLVETIERLKRAVEIAAPEPRSNNNTKKESI